ncbi:MAG: hypothetical protein PHR16_11950 [Methylovulum sp.]|nr:hypothetical protein [Methylovulum sp.]
MWVVLNDAFLSIVAERDDPNRLLVRARFPNDIARVFPDAEVTETPHADYRFRTFLPREVVASHLADAVRRCDYPNFKSSVWEQWRHDLYLKIWRILYESQKNRLG